MSNIAIIEDILKNFRYKPGYRINWSYFDDMLRLHIEFRVPDAVDPKHPMVTITHNNSLNVGELNHVNDVKGFFIHWLWEKIQKAEIHEAGEWFEINGSKPFYPMGSHAGEEYEQRHRA